MSVRSGQSVATTFVTSRFDTGAATNADSTPGGTLYVNGTADAATVTVTNVTTGLYKAAVTLPTLAVGDVVNIVIAATVNSVAAKGKVWEDTKDVFAGAIPDVAAGGAGGLFIAGSNAATTISGLTTGALSATTITASGAVAFQSTFSVTTSTSLGAISGSTLTLSGAVAFQSTFAVTTSTSLGAISGSTLTLSGAVAFQSTFAVTTSTSLGALSATTITASGTTSLAAVTTSGTVTLNALTVSNATTLTGAVTATNASNDIRGIQLNSLSAAGITAIEDAAWDAVLADHLDAGSTGFALNAAGSAGDPWGTALPGAYGAGTAGFIIGTNLDATISSRGTSTLTQSQVSGGAYALNSASFAFNSALDFTTTQKAATLARVSLVDVASTVTDGAKSATALSTATWTNTLATNLGTTNTTVATNLDTTVSSRGTSTLTQAQVLTTALTESYAADGVAPTLAQFQFMMWSLLAERSVVTTTLTASKLDGTPAMTFTLDSSVAPTSQTRSS